MIENLAMTSIDDIDITSELSARPVRAPLHEAEARIYQLLASKIGQSADDLLTALTVAALELCGAGSAGVSLLDTSEEGGGLFRWVALSGEYRSFLGGTTPRDFSPCGTCLDRMAPVLYRQPQRRFTYLASATPAIEEGLVLPFHARGVAIGTIWIVSHDARTHFDLEDARIMTNLASFTAAAFTVMRARDDAERRDHDTQLFAAMLSHDLQNPLAAISMQAAVMVRQRQLPDAQRAGAERIARAEMMSRLIGQVLDFARMRFTDGIRLERGPVALARVCEEVIAQLTAAQPDCSIRLEADVDTVGNWDRVRIAQIAFNLISNAVRHGDRTAPIAVDVRGRQAHVVFEVRNQGLPIPSELLGRIFEPFQRHDDRREGLGLGLYIAHSLVVAHGGTLTACSSSDETRFTVTLPRG